jgi:hypothetical protein
MSYFQRVSRYDKGETIMTENQRVILGDAISCAETLFEITTDKESKELADRIADDIRTVLRLERQNER